MLTNISSPEFSSIFFPLLLFLLSTFFLEQCSGNSVPSRFLSKGCQKKTLPDGIEPDKLFRKSLAIADPRLGYTVERQFLVRVPGRNSGNPEPMTEPRQLIIYFHGFTGNALDVATKYEYNLMSRPRGTIMIYPEGMSDYDFPNGTHVSSYQGWNAVGSSQSEQENCRVELDSCHYRSCMTVGVCAKCAFATCSNDTLFVSELLDWSFDNLCVDTSDVIATGLSNGALMTYELITKMPKQFRAFIAVYGVPMQGFLNFSSPAIRGRPLLHIHGHSDEWIPFDGSHSTVNNVKFESTPTVLDQYAKTQGCGTKTKRWLTPFDTINNFTCNQYVDCDLDPNVILCTYSGGHTYPPMIEEATFLFLQQVQKHREDTGADFSKSSSWSLGPANLLIIAITSLLYKYFYIC